ncbi:hypothetical protein ACLOJK_039503 [Asimina triloba]
MAKLSYAEKRDRSVSRHFNLDVWKHLSQFRPEGKVRLSKLQRGRKLVRVDHLRCKRFLDRVASLGSLEFQQQDRVKRFLDLECVKGQVGHSQILDAEKALQINLKALTTVVFDCLVGC